MARRTGPAGQVDFGRIARRRSALGPERRTHAHDVRADRVWRSRPTSLVTPDARYAADRDGSTSSVSSPTMGTSSSVSHVITARTRRGTERPCV